MSVDAVALTLALQAQHDAVLRETLAALHDDVRTVAVVVEHAIRARAEAGVSLDALVPLSEVRLELHAALTHLERALKEGEGPPCRPPEAQPERSP